MPALNRPRPARRGNVIPLVAVLLTVLFGMVAFTVDVGLVAVVRSELQNTADAAALAGASQLYNRSATSVQALQTSAERTKVKEEAARFARANGPCMRGSFTTEGSSSFQLAPSDVELGVVVDGVFYPSTIYPATIKNQKYALADSVRVTVRRQTASQDGGNGSVRLFFAPALGIRESQVSAMAVASMRAAYSFRPPNKTAGERSSLLPFALDHRIWTLLTMATPPKLHDVKKLFPELKTEEANQVLDHLLDDFAYDPNKAPVGDNYSGRVKIGGDGLREFSVFPMGHGNKLALGMTPGNFGTIDLGQGSNSTDELGKQIRYGPTPEALKLLMERQRPPQQDVLTVPFRTGGDTGVSAGIKDDVLAITGQPRTLPLYDVIAGPGNNAVYNVVAFAGVTIVDSDFRGSNKSVRIQPCVVVDDTAVANDAPTATSFVFGPVQLAQ